jgi:hypothetical protein
LQRKEWTEGRLQPNFISVFPKIKKKKDREKRNTRRRESFANKFQQYFEILTFGTKHSLKFCKYFGLLDLIEIRKGDEGFYRQYKRNRKRFVPNNVGFDKKYAR